jgi:hypothetical protein
MTEAVKPLPVARERLPNRREHVLINFTTADGFRYKLNDLFKFFYAFCFD